MTKRITVMMPDDLDKKLRKLQAKAIEENQSSYSYSRILGETLRTALK